MKSVLTGLLVGALMAITIHAQQTPAIRLEWQAQTNVVDNTEHISKEAMGADKEERFERLGMGQPNHYRHHTTTVVYSNLVQITTFEGVDTTNILRKVGVSTNTVHWIWVKQIITE